MGLIGFSMFREKIEDGSKPHTIRFRKEPPAIGEELYLWWKSRTADRELIGITVCTRIQAVSIDPLRKIVRVSGAMMATAPLAIKDGFECVDDFWHFFKDRKPSELGYLIHWEPTYIIQNRLRPIVVEHGGFEGDRVIGHRSYLPSNASCGTSFQEQWCDQCSRDKFDGTLASGAKSCPILMAAIMGERPRQWISHEGGECCTVFSKPKTTNTGAKYATLERKGQLNLFQV